MKLKKKELRFRTEFIDFQLIKVRFLKSEFYVHLRLQRLQSRIAFSILLIKIFLKIERKFSYLRLYDEFASISYDRWPF